MCGIIGFFGNKNYNKDKIRFLFLANISRGKDATGIWTPKLDKPIKQTVEATKFLATSEFNTLEESKMLIGHVRMGNSGSKTDVDNAHPFKYDWLVGCHNGSLNNESSLASKEKLVKGTDWNTDTQVMLQILAKRKDHTIFQEIDGSAAVLFTDVTKKEPIMYVFRNKERPLHFGLVDGNIYISSEKESLESLGADKIQEFPVDKLITIENIKKNESVVDYVADNKAVLSYGDYKFTYLDCPTKVIKVNHNHNDLANTVKAFVGRWLMIDSHTLKDDVFKVDNWYLCNRAFNKDNSIFLTLVDRESKKSITVPKMWVSYSYHMFTDNTKFVKCMVTITDESNDEIIFNIGDILKVDNVEEATVTVTDATGTSWEINKKWCRPLISKDPEFGIYMQTLTAPSPKLTPIIDVDAVDDDESDMRTRHPYSYLQQDETEDDDSITLSDKFAIADRFNVGDLVEVKKNPTDTNSVYQAIVKEINISNGIFTLQVMGSEAIMYIGFSSAEKLTVLSTSDDYVKLPNVKKIDSYEYDRLFSEVAKLVYKTTKNLDKAKELDEFLLDGSNTQIEYNLSEYITGIEDLQTAMDSNTGISMQEFKAYQEMIEECHTNLSEVFNEIVEKCNSYKNIIKRKEKEIAQLKTNLQMKEFDFKGSGM